MLCFLNTEIHPQCNTKDYGRLFDLLAAQEAENIVRIENVIFLEEFIPGKCILVWQLFLEVQHIRQ